VLSSRAVDGHQMYFGGSVVCTASKIGIWISPTPPLIFTVGQKVRNLASFKTPLEFEAPTFENAARYPNSETKVQCCDNRPMSWPSMVKWSPRIPETVCQSCPIAREKALNRDNSAVDYSISLKFCTEFKRMTPEVP